jgi:hypothetical protein
VQLKKEEWLPVSCKRHQIGHLDFWQPRLLTEELPLQICSTVTAAPLLKIEFVTLMCASGQKSMTVTNH